MIYADIYNSVVKATDSLEAVKWYLIHTPLKEVNQSGWDALVASIDTVLRDLSVSEKKLGILKRCNEKTADNEE